MSPVPARTVKIARGPHLTSVPRSVPRSCVPAFTGTRSHIPPFPHYHIRHSITFALLILWLVEQTNKLATAEDNYNNYKQHSLVISGGSRNFERGVRWHIHSGPPKALRRAAKRRSVRAKHGKKNLRVLFSDQEALS